MVLPKPVSLPWSGPLPPFRDQLPGESIVTHSQLEGEWMLRCCQEQKAVHLLEHPEDLRLNRATRVTSES